jgi:Ca2+-binding RTX toxin-like protein
MFDTFTYTMKDSAGATSTATVEVQVLGAADGTNIYGTVNPDAGATALKGTTKNEQIELNNGNDEGYGFAGSDRLMGQNGDDKMWGGDGNDKLWGDRGNDLLYGERHNDDMFSGLGNDTFVFNLSSVAGEVDRIGDFKKGVDFIRLEGGITVTDVDNTQDLGKIDGSNIVGSSGGTIDTVLTLSNDAKVVLIDCNFANMDGLLAL